MRQLVQSGGLRLVFVIRTINSVVLTFTGTGKGTSSVRNS